jgi:hypothetical protein
MYVFNYKMSGGINMDPTNVGGSLVSCMGTLGQMAQIPSCSFVYEASTQAVYAVSYRNSYHRYLRSRRCHLRRRR